MTIKQSLRRGFGILVALVYFNRSSISFIAIQGNFIYLLASCREPRVLAYISLMFSYLYSY
jgi:hypothetical protein